MLATHTTVPRLNGVNRIRLATPPDGTPPPRKPWHKRAREWRPTRAQRESLRVGVEAASTAVVYVVIFLAGMLFAAWRIRSAPPQPPVHVSAIDAGSEVADVGGVDARAEW
jgi:hypothetical protein